MNDGACMIKIITVDDQKWVPLTAYESERRHYWQETEKLRNLLAELEENAEKEHRDKERRIVASMAMEGMIAGLTKFREDLPGIIVNRPQDIAEISCVYADALIAELEKK